MQEGLLTWRRRHDRAEETREVRGAEETREVPEAEEAREAREEAEEAVEKVVKWNGDSGRHGIVKRQGRYPPKTSFTEFVTCRTHPGEREKEFVSHPGEQEKRIVSHPREGRKENSSPGRKKFFQHV